MSKVVSLNSRKVLDLTVRSQNGHQTPEEMFLFIGAIVSMVLPQIIICLEFGTAGLAVSLLDTSLGIVLGIWMHGGLPYKFRSDTGDTGKRSSPPAVEHEYHKLRKAA